MRKRCCVCGDRIPGHDFAMKTDKGLACSECLVYGRRAVPPYGSALRRKPVRTGITGSRTISVGA